MTLVIAEMTLFVAISLFVITSTVLFHSKRNQFPISRRTPILASYVLVYSSAAMAFTDMITNTVRVQCVFPNVFINVATHVFLISFGVKVVDLSIAYEHELIKRKIARMDGSKLKSFKVPFNVRMHKYLTTERRPALLIGATAVFITCVIAIGLLLGSPAVFDSDALWGSEKCQVLTFILSVGGFVNVGVLAVVTLMVAESLRKVRDNFSKKFEVKALLCLLIVSLIWWNVGNFIPDAVAGPIITIFWNQLHPFFVTYVCFLDAWRKAKKFEDANSKGLEDQSYSGNETPTRISFQQRGDDDKEAPSPLDVSVPRNPQATLISNMTQIERILDDPVLFAELEEFMSKDFSVEGVSSKVLLWEPP